MAFAATILAGFLILVFLAWRQYLWAGRWRELVDTCPYSLTDVFGRNHLAKVPHQKGVRWLPEIFSRSAVRYPDLPALQIPHTGETLTYAELDARAERVAAAVSPFLTGPDQVVAVAMPQDNCEIVAAHLGVLRAGGTLVVLDTTLPDALLAHMLDDARPVVVLTRGEAMFRALPTLDLLALPQELPERRPPSWLDDPAQRLATIFYTSGTTGLPKGVDCPHAGYVNLALTYADYFDFVPGVDATSLTSSLGYDGSISEMYSAWVSGCAVVLLTKGQVRSGPELVPVLCEAEVTVLFCPPVLLTALTLTPEVDLPYPLCRYIVPAGEAFPAALVEPWTRGRRQIINTYGPTEGSTDTSRQSLRAGEPITIGSPFANVTYVILEVDGLTPLPHGEVGELCIGGVHLARGYRNLPEQTAHKFITHPRFGRLYRTGDRCRIDIRTQRVHFLGRLDAQLKVRGHRVEAHAVEDILQSEFREIEAAVLDYQNEALVAFVAAPSLFPGKIRAAVPAPAEWATCVTALLAERLPAPSVPSSIYLVEKFATSPVSGKIDRKRLPNLSTLTKPAAPEIEPPLVRKQDGEQRETEPPRAEAALPPGSEEVLAICRAVIDAPLGWDDGFAESGGHSIAIARLAQRLHAAGWHVSVRALLTDCNTPRKVARGASQAHRAATAPTVSARPAESRARRDEHAAEVLPVGYFTTLQVLFALFLYLPGLVGFFVALAYIEIGTFFATASLGAFIAVGGALYLLGLLLPFAALLWVRAIKRIMGGDALSNNVTPGVYPKWSRMHLRIWCITRLESAVLLPLGAMYRSAPLLAFALRQLGATVGRNLQCAHDAYLAGPVDLLSIGDDVAIQTGAYIRTARLVGSNVHVGPIRFESGCKIGMRAAVVENLTIGRGTWITPFTPILGDVGAHEMWEGAPARLTGHYTELTRTARVCQYAQPIWLLETLNVLMQVFIYFWLSLLPGAAILWFAREFIPAGEAGLSDTYFQVTPLPEIAWQLTLYAFISAWLGAVVLSVLTCLFIRWTAAAPGLYPVHGLHAALLMYRMKGMNSLQGQWTWTITGQYLRALAGLRFPRVGASECDVMFNLVPDAASADTQVFWANGCFTNMLDCSATHFTLRQLEMPRNFFSGNNCVAEYGQLPDNFMLGVSTPASDIEFRRQMRLRPGAPITVAGNPPVRFASAAFEEENKAIKPPGFRLFLTRVLLNDFFSVGTLGIAEGLIFTILFVCGLRWGADPITGTIAALVVAEACLIALCVGIKAALVGRWGADDATPFWSWKHFAYFFAQDCFFAWCRGPLGFSAGTILSNPILRWMGCRIGSRTIVTQPMQCSDWNAVDFGNDCTVDGFLQFHSFENMTLKVKRTRIGDGCAVSFGATVMGGAKIERDTTLLPLSLVLKEVSLSTATYEGSPVEPIEAQSGCCDGRSGYRAR
ncbi:AMP-binding protein [Hyphomicrobium sp. CS1GBMeth3]|uniref:non-ribosomal peptide synthetase n=1 Tax=Hyphomicrobium sp. CS1GBMeth3 TaxID=1892845 RepID=UPI0009308ABC|nr:AMP-binding protein [Hyphomicrobium sp. CS1GBMeth3]